MPLWNIGTSIAGNSVASLASSFPTRMALAMTAAVGESLAALQNEHKRKQIKRGGKPSPDTWTTRTGSLRRSFHIDWSPGHPEGAYGSDLKRAAKVELGGVIKSSRPGGYLAIPTKDAPKKAWPRELHDLFLVKSQKGNLLLASNRGGRLVPMFVLRRSVTLPPRPALDRAVEATEGSRRAAFLRAVDVSIGRP